MGVEGFVAQLQQIIYSTTEFPTVDRVQILIEGKRVEYLGGEGIYIGEPISRNTFG
jgi:spore germination protein GerM